MSSRFISGGTISSGGGDSFKDDVTNAVSQPAEPLMSKPSEWEAVQKELEADRKRREDQRAVEAAGGQQSLYDILQANKAAKQAAFEERNKLKNQFLSLNDDEIEFLDEVVSKQRMEEDRLKRQTEQELKAFREAQKGGGDGAGEGPGAATSPDRGDDGAGEDWAAAGVRKRKRAKEREALGVKKKAVDNKGGTPAPAAAAVARKQEEPSRNKDEEKTAGKVQESDEKEQSSPLGKGEGKGLNLVGYGSGDSDDD